MKNDIKLKSYKKNVLFIEFFSFSLEQKFKKKREQLCTKGGITNNLNLGLV